MRQRLICTVGRMNPPTAGHEKLVSTVDRCAQLADCDSLIVVTKTEDDKNPLDPAKKIRHLARAFPNHYIVVTDQWVKGLIDLAPYWETLVLVCGNDRKEHYQRIIDQTLNKYWKRIELVSVTRNDVSATKMREHITADDFENFWQMLPSKLKRYRYAKELYDDVRSKL